MWIFNIMVLFILTPTSPTDLTLSLPEASLPGNETVIEEVPKLPENDSGIFMPFGSLHTIENLSYWSNNEEEIYNVLKLRRENILKEIDLISRFLSDYDESSLKALEETNVPLEPAEQRGRLIGANPILAHRMTDRYAFEINELRKLMNCSGYQQNSRGVKVKLELNAVEENSNESFTSRKWPSQQDLFVSLTAILEIQSFYELKADQIINGITHDSQFGGTLNSSDATLFGLFSLRNKFYYLNINWFEFTLEYIDRLELGKDNHVSDFTNKDFVASLLQVAIAIHNYMLKIDNFTEHSMLYSFVDPIMPESDTNVPFRQDAIKKYGRIYGNLSSDVLNMYLLCKGEDFQPQHVKSQLHCFLEKRRHPYFILNHLKTEQLSKYPYIVQLYEVLGNDTIDELFKARGELLISTVHRNRDVESIEYRSSAGSLTSENFTYKIQNKSEILTGLLLHDMIEGIQTVEYTYGRLYKVHADPFSKPFGLGDDNDNDMDKNLEEHVAKFGDRVATLLYYIDVPEQGGGTAFTQVGINARPVRGSAVFWLNAFRNGSTRGDISHAACPVLHGYKSIINQWVRYHVNFKNFKCGLNQFE